MHQHYLTSKRQQTIALYNRLPVIYLIMVLMTLLTGCGGGSQGSESPSNPPVNGQWSSKSVIDSQSSNASTIQTSIDSQGNVYAVWIHDSNGTNTLWWNKYVPGVGWSDAKRIADDANVNILEHHLGTDSQGNVIVVWINDESLSSIWSKQYDPNIGWKQSELLGVAPNGHFSFIKIAVTPAGRSIAVWTHYDETSGNGIWAAHYVPDVGWEVSTRINNPSENSAYKAHIAMDASGNALVVWNNLLDTPTSSRNWYSRYTTSGGWETPIKLSFDTNGWEKTPRIAGNGNGEFFAVWVKDDIDFTPTIYARRYSAGGWEDPVLLFSDSDFGDALPQVAVSDAGNAMIVWHMNDRQGRSSIYSVDFNVDQGWGNIARISTEDTYWIERPQLAVNSSGVYMAMWYEGDQFNDQGFYAYAVNTLGEWTTPSHSAVPARMFDGHILIDDNNYATAVWLEFTGNVIDVYADHMQ